MSNLLTVKKFRSKATEKGKTPLLVENIPVDPQCAPYLVTSSEGVIWIEKPHPGDVVRAAVRTVTPGQVFTELLEAIVERSEIDGWGSVQPYTENGLHEAIRYLSFYGLTDVEVLMPPTPKKDWPKWLLTKNLGLHVRPSSWIPKGHLVVIPHERDYVGMIGHLDGLRVAALVHNASRGVAVLKKKTVKKTPVKASKKDDGVVEVIKKIIDEEKDNPRDIGEHPYGVEFSPKQKPKKKTKKKK